MVSKYHGIIGALSILALVSNLLWLPSAINANYGLVTGNSNNPIQLDLAALGQSLSVTTYQSGVLKCTFYENVYADYNDGTSQLVGTNWTYPANPLITQSLVNPANPTKTINDFYVSLGEMCNNIPSYVASTTVSGNIQVYAQVSGSDGQQHVLVGGTNVNVQTQNIVNGGLLRFYSYKILSSQISQYNNLQGTNQFTLKVYVQPTLNYVSTFSADSGLSPQNSVYSGWITQFFTGNSVSGTTTFTPQPTSSLPLCSSTTSQTCIPSSPTSCPSGTTYSSTYQICLASSYQTPVITPPTTPVGTTIATANVKFFYSLIFQGDPSQYCGTAIPAPATGCVVAPTSGPLSLPLTSFNIIGSTKGTINSLQTFNVEPVMTPSIKGLNLNPSTSVVYTGALKIDGKTIAIPSSGITSDQKAFVDADGNFRFPTATINPVTIDQILKQNGIQPTSPDNLVIRIYANGKFTGTGPNGQFQGILNGPYIDISVWYVSNTAPIVSQPPPPPSGTTPNPNCNFGTNPDGTCIPTPAPPVTSCPTGQQAVITGTSTYTCITPPPPKSCPVGQFADQNGVCSYDSPPTTPPNPCVNISAGGICMDPPPNPTTPPPNPNPSPSPSPVMFPPPDTTPTTQPPPNPSGTCTGTDCLTNFNNSTIPSGISDPNMIYGLIISIVAVILIIAMIINKRKNN